MPIDQHTLMRSLLADRAKLLGYIWVIVRDEHAAEDIFQDVSMLALDKRAEIADRDHLHGWLRQAARNKALHWLRNQRRAPMQLDADVMELIAPHFARHDSLNGMDVIDALRACREQLSPYAQRIIEHRYREGLTGPALAEALGRSINTVYQAMTRAHTALADCVKARLASQGAGHG
jgi:RNA polymerase sigma-70 factor (ECF subfamily)